MKGVLFVFLVITFAISSSAWSQYYEEQGSTQLLDEVVVSGRIAESYRNLSKSIQVISSAEIAQSGAIHLVDFLQRIVGLDVRRRGVGPTQADLNLRGGSFDQTLLLIDGIALEDAQTGHHLSNFFPPIALIERIEIVRGSAARIFGQNAFSGAINIITKTSVESTLQVQLNGGSFETTGAEIVTGHQTAKTRLLAQASSLGSAGYRYNTDFTQRQYLVSLSQGSVENALRVLGFFSPRKFGANGFYASPSAVDQYEETQASLIAITKRITQNNTRITPRIYWRRGQDMYEYIRDRPDIYRNMHITHKVGAAVDVGHDSSIGTSGFGVDVSRSSIQSNNLGERSRDIVNLFAEQLISLGDGVLDVTPGLVYTYVSNFGSNVFPGVEIGAPLGTAYRTYINWGTTFRVPTFTDLYYADPTTLGNENLVAESATSLEWGFRYSQQNISASAAVFTRKSTNLIDYVKEKESEKFQAQNIQELQTSGVELSVDRFSDSSQTFTVGYGLSYTYIAQRLSEEAAVFSRYSIDNDLKHQLIVRMNATMSTKRIADFNLRYIERASGRTYTILDAHLSQQLGNFRLQASLNNLLNQAYWETSLISMPGRNVSFSLGYSL